MVVQTINRKHITDPHDCESSCIVPGLDCEACTHPDYNFTCKKDGLYVCLHQDLICDGHPQCEDAADEQLDYCLEIYIEILNRTIFLSDKW